MSDSVLTLEQITADETQAITSGFSSGIMSDPVFTLEQITAEMLAATGGVSNASQCPMAVRKHGTSYAQAVMHAGQNSVVDCLAADLLGTAMSAQTIAGQLREKQMQHADEQKRQREELVGNGLAIPIMLARLLQRQAYEQQQCLTTLLASLTSFVANWQQLALLTAESEPGIFAWNGVRVYGKLADAKTWWHVQTHCENVFKKNPDMSIDAQQLLHIVETTLSLSRDLTIASKQTAIPFPSRFVVKEQRPTEH